jgi:16S rRNA (cytosine1402-N4)-methyltransferase
VCSGGSATSAHIPVLFQQVLDGLCVKPGGAYIDATVGGGGHAQGILAASAPDGTLLGLDRDPEALAVARAQLVPFSGRVVLRHCSFAQIGQVASAEGFSAADGILLDLGLSSRQLADPARGFAFSTDGPLDMRFDQTEDGPTAADLVNGLSADQLYGLLRDYGEEPNARQIARAIVAARPVMSTTALAEVVIRTAPRGRRRIHPATRTFQALRIAVNRELDEIEKALPQAVQSLAEGGRIAVISFHSLEDRLVKRFLRRESRDCICPPESPVCRCQHRACLRLVTRKPVRPSAQEVAGNPRARSARLRIAERVRSPAYRVRGASAADEAAT